MSVTLDYFHVDLSGSNNEFYANGNQQIQINITYQKSDGSQLKSDELKTLTLINYDTNNDFDGSSGLSIDRERNEFDLPTGSIPNMRGDNGSKYGIPLYLRAIKTGNYTVGARVTLDGGNTYTTNQSGGGDQFDSYVKIQAVGAVNYSKDDINWSYYAANTTEGNTYNYTLKVNTARNDQGYRFIRFDIGGGYVTQSGYYGLMGWCINDDWKNFFAVYVWPDYSEKNVDQTIINVPGGGGAYWSPTVRTYDLNRIYNDYLTFTWVFDRCGGGKCKWSLAGPMTYWWQYFNTQITAYDQFGNFGTFWLDNRNIATQGFKKAEGQEKFSEDEPILYRASANEPSVSSGNTSNSESSSPKLDIYDHPVN